MTNPILKSTSIQDEVNRLSTNWRTLLNAMPEMVLLLSERHSVEYMNPSAQKHFGKKGSPKVVDDLCRIGVGAQGKQTIEAGRPQTVAQEAVIGDIPVEYSSVPFAGYTGERLTMYVMRDISRRKARKRSYVFLIPISKISSSRKLPNCRKARRCDSGCLVR